MRILVVSHYALPHLGGIEVVIDALARELVRRGHDVVHVASNGRSIGSPQAPPPDTPYRVIRVPALNVLERAHVPYPVFSPALATVLRREIARADVVHAHGVLYMSSAVAVEFARRAPAQPVRVITEHVGHVPYENAVLDRVQAAALKTLGRRVARGADALVALNEKVDAELATVAPGVRRARIHNGVDTDRYRPREPGERAAVRAAAGWDDVPRVLFVGRLVAKKGVHAALAAVARANGAWRLVVVGPGRLPGEAPPGTEVLGALEPDRVAQLYGAADAFLLPSRGEGFPVTAQEAMASGLPVVLGADPAYAEYLDGAGEGARTAPAEASALAAAVAQVLATPGAGAEAAAHARRAFSWARAAQAHEALFEELRAARIR